MLVQNSLTSQKGKKSSCSMLVQLHQLLVIASRSHGGVGSELKHAGLHSRHNQVGIYPATIPRKLIP